MNEYKIFVHRIGLMGVTNILIAISSLILLPIVTKNFSIGDYGVWVQFNITMNLITNIGTLGLPYAMVRFLSAEKDKEKIREGFYSITGIVLVSIFIICILLLVFSKTIAIALFNDNYKLGILLSLVVFFTSLNSLLLNYYRTLQQMKRFSFFLIIQTYLGLFIVSYFAIKGFGVYMAAFGLLIANIIIFIAMIVFIITNIGFKIPKFKNMREYISFGLPTIPGNLSSWIVDSSDRYVIGIFLGASFVGYYTPSYTLGSIILLIISPFSTLLPSVLPEYYDKNNIEKVNTFLKYSMKYFLLIAIPSAFGLSILSQPILNILTTQEIALNGYLITPFVSLSVILFGIYTIISNILVLEKQTRIIGRIWIITAVLNLILNIIFVPYLGIFGAAAITLIAYGMAFILTLLYSLKFFKFDFDIVFIFKSIISSVNMTFVINSIHPQGILGIFMAISTGCIIYLISIIVLKGIKEKEIYFFKNLLIHKS
ncbi:MAG: oligosaccharide flippase family protein [Methanobacteriaceae archaeon]|nr:oligosaccharide flippase family protein [Methanobacteriaceae archaeon]